MKYILITTTLLFIVLASCSNADEGGATDTIDSSTKVSGAAIKPLAAAFRASCPLPTPLPAACTLPASCTTTASCTDPVCQDAILECHRIIDEATFLTLRTNYNVKLYKGKQIPAANIEAEITAHYGTCDQFALKLFDNSVRAGNEDIDHEPEIISRAAPVEARYSIAFFKAVIERKNAVTFEFYKAAHILAAGGKCDDIIFKAYDGEGEQVYCGDLAGLYP